MVHEHQLPFSHPIPDQLRILAPRMTLQADFSPFVDEPSGEYEFDDAYYIPFWNFGGVMRPGPRVRIYRWEPAR